MPPSSYLPQESSPLADDEGYYFALAVIKGEIRLVQSTSAQAHQRASAFTRSIGDSITIYPALGNDPNRHQNVQTRASDYISARSVNDNAP